MENAQPKRSRTPLKIGIAIACALSVTSIAFWITNLDGTRETPVNSGPLNDGGNAGEICTPARDNAPVTFGEHILQNTGTKQVVIDRIDLYKPVGMEIADSVLVPYPGWVKNGGTLIGVGRPYPPPTRSRAWSNRRPAVGATVQPTRDDVDNLVLGLRVAGVPRATAQGVEIAYHVGGRRFIFRTAMRIVLIQNPGKC